MVNGNPATVVDAARYWLDVPLCLGTKKALADVIEVVEWMQEENRQLRIDNESLRHVHYYVLSDSNDDE